MSCAALFELLLPAVGGSAAAQILGETAEGTAAAVAIYEQALAAAPVEASPLTLRVFCFAYMPSRSCRGAFPSNT